MNTEVNGMIWTSNIIVKHSEAGWIAYCYWCSGELVKSGCMEGKIATRYYEHSIAQAIDYVLESMKHMNIARSDEIEELKETIGFALLLDEESEDINENERKIIMDEAQRRGWKCYIDK